MPMLEVPEINVELMMVVVLELEIVSCVVAVPILEVLGISVELMMVVVSCVIVTFSVHNRELSRAETLVVTTSTVRYVESIDIELPDDEVKE